MSQLSSSTRRTHHRQPRFRQQLEAEQWDGAFVAAELRSSPAPLGLTHRPPTKQSLAKLGLRIGRTPVGKGLFATKRIVDGCCIGEIRGLVICDDEYVSRYAFDLDDGRQLEPDAPFRFVNHSCEPNCAFQNFSFPGSRSAVSSTVSSTVSSIGAHPQVAAERKLLLFSICDIDIGQELTIDYNWPAIFAIPCGCRSPGCRGWIVAPKDLPQLLDGFQPEVFVN